jgi:type I protein arginine methyltransferase
MRAHTGPGERYTHWKQTVFYLEAPLTVQADEVVHGQLTCRPNGANPRDLDIAIRYELDGAVCAVAAEQTYRMC